MDFSKNVNFFQKNNMKNINLEIIIKIKKQFY